MAETQPKDNFVSRMVQGYQSIVPNPLVSSLLLGGAVYGLSSLAWNPITDTVRSLGRLPGKALGDMTDAEWDEAMDNLQNNPRYKRWIPLALAGLGGGAHLLTNFKANKEGYGLLDWNPKTVYYHNDRNQLTFNQGMHGQKKTGALHKSAENLFEFDNYVPAVDFAQAVNARDAIGLFTNDPHLANHQYARNLGTSIIADAALRAGTNNPTMGGVFDSAVNKFENKLSFAGVAEVGVKTVVANGAARLLTGALGAVCGLPPEAQRHIVDAGTWAGAVTAILE